MADPQEDPPDLEHIAPIWFMDKWMELTDWLIAHRPVAGLGIILCAADGGGMRIDADPARISQLVRHPFQLVTAGDKFRVIYGTVNNIEPAGMLPGDVPPFLFDPGGSAGYVWLGLSSDGDTVSSVWIDWGATVADDSTGEYHLIIGSWDDKLTIAQSIGGSQWFELCGGQGGNPLWGLV